MYALILKLFDVIDYFNIIFTVVAKIIVNETTLLTERKQKQKCKTRMLDSYGQEYMSDTIKALKGRYSKFRILHFISYQLSNSNLAKVAKPVINQRKIATELCSADVQIDHR